jgi:hypothetical protein
MTDIELSYALQAEEEPDVIPENSDDGRKDDAAAAIVAVPSVASAPSAPIRERVNQPQPQSASQQRQSPPGRPLAESVPPPELRELEQTIAGLRQFLTGRKLEESEAALRRMYERSARWQDDFGADHEQR